MKIHTVWGERKSFEGEQPELLVAWTEYQIDANPEGFKAALQEEKASWGDDLVQERHVVIDIDDEKLIELFKVAMIEGKIE